MHVYTSVTLNYTNIRICRYIRSFASRVRQSIKLVRDRSITPRYKSTMFIYGWHRYIYAAAVSVSIYSAIGSHFKIISWERERAQVLGSARESQTNSSGYKTVSPAVRLIFSVFLFRVISSCATFFFFFFPFLDIFRPGFQPLSMRLYFSYLFECTNVLKLSLALCCEDESMIIQYYRDLYWQMKSFTCKVILMVKVKGDIN